MARGLDETSFQRLEASAPVTTMPLALACRYRVPAIGGGKGMVELHKNGAGGHKYELFFQGAPLRCQVFNSSGKEFAQTTDWSVAGQWHTAVAVFASTTSRSIYLDNDKATDTTSYAAPSGIDTLRIGVWGWSSPSYQYYFTGDVADVLVLNGAPTDSQVASFSAGAHPQQAFGGLVAAHYPLGGLDGNHDRDLISGTTLSTSGGPTWVEHPDGLIYPTAPQFVLPSYVEAGGDSLATSAFQLGMFIND